MPVEFASSLTWPLWQYIFIYAEDLFSQETHDTCHCFFRAFQMYRFQASNTRLKSMSKAVKPFEPAK